MSLLKCVPSSWNEPHCFHFAEIVDAQDLLFELYYDAYFKNRDGFYLTNREHAVNLLLLGLLESEPLQSIWGFPEPLRKQPAFRVFQFNAVKRWTFTHFKLNHKPIDFDWTSVIKDPLLKPLHVVIADQDKLLVPPKSVMNDMVMSTIFQDDDTDLLQTALTRRIHESNQQQRVDLERRLRAIQDIVNFDISPYLVRIAQTHGQQMSKARSNFTAAPTLYDRSLMEILYTTRHGQTVLGKRKRANQDKKTQPLRKKKKKKNPTKKKKPKCIKIVQLIDQRLQDSLDTQKKRIEQYFAIPNGDDHYNHLSEVEGGIRTYNDGSTPTKDKRIVYEKLVAGARKLPQPLVVVLLEAKNWNTIKHFYRRRLHMNKIIVVEHEHETVMAHYDGRSSEFGKELGVPIDIIYHKLFVAIRRGWAVGNLYFLDYMCTFSGNGHIKPKTDIEFLFQQTKSKYQTFLLGMTCCTRDSKKPRNVSSVTYIQQYMEQIGATYGYKIVDQDSHTYKTMVYVQFLFTNEK